ncbi:MAG: flippase-like domain-containing protein [Kofleriaceae bacterium]|nr:flippase-like domain-containing protein [Kofleriaceae bacterium]
MTAGRAKPEKHLASHAFNIGVLVVGTVALVWMLNRLGMTNVRRVFAGVGSWFFVIVAFDVAALACEAGAIREFMRPEARMVSYWRVLAAQASGRAINILTPGGALGEPTKITMLVSSAPRGRVVSSIVLLNLAAFYLSVAIVIVGVPITALLVDLPHDLRLVVWVGLGILVPLVVAIGVMIQRGALQTVLGAARGLRLLSAERKDKWAAKLAELDRHIRSLQASGSEAGTHGSTTPARSHGSTTPARSPGTRSGLLLVCSARLCSWSATTLALYSVGVHLHFTLLAGVFSVGVLIGWISAIVPFGLGVADGGNYALFNVLGASGAQGVFVTLLGRARSLTLALLGLVAMAAAHSVNRLELARRNRLMARLEAAHGSEALEHSG